MEAGHAVLYAVLAASALAGFYILWGPNSSRPKHRRKALFPGLLNLGKFCFLNSLQQSLASCSEIVKWLAVNDKKATEREDQQQQQKSGNQRFTLLSTLYELLKVLNNQSSDAPKDCADATDVLKALKSHRWFLSDEEQDAHELFLAVTTTLKDEVHLRANVPSLTDLANIDDLSSSRTFAGISRFCSKLPTVSQKVDKQAIPPFMGLLTSQLRCKSCGQKSPTKFDTFDSISLSIPTRHWAHSLTLQDCLRHFMMPEQVQDVDCDHCSSLQQKCSKDTNITIKTKSTFMKQLNIGKLPDVLCIHIQRMACVNSGILMKRCEHVTFPEFLNMNEFMYMQPGEASILNFEDGTKPMINRLVGGSNTPDRSKGNSNSDTINSATPLASCISQIGLANGCGRALFKNTSKNSSCDNRIYRLQSVIVHCGVDVNSGHFVTYRRGIIGTSHRNSWYYCSDAVIHEVQFRDVLSCDAYMLMYERVKPSSCNGSTSSTVAARID